MLQEKAKSHGSKGGIRLRVKSRLSSQILPKHVGELRLNSRIQQPVKFADFITALCILVIIYVVVIEWEKKLPTPLMISDEPNNPGRFIAERAKNYVRNLTSIGPRPTGSFESEVLAVNYLSRELKALNGKVKSIHRLSVDLQKTSGSFQLEFLDGMTNVYKNVQNVIVKISSQEGSPHSLLINCHFDTVADSPGGSDDGASCGVMLEMLRVLTQSDVPLMHNIIFLFNGAEENLMQGSHGFITQHRWASEVRAFINLEACGAGGRELLFQAGPEQPWLMQLYSEAVPYPLASSLAEEVFQSGIIPGDTDYRIFRDFGRVSGLDFAWSANGYVYHTRLDTAAQIPLGTLQRTGDNILPLARRLASAPQLAASSAAEQGHHHGLSSLVFFDVLGATIISWSQLVGTVMNLVVLTLSVYTLCWSVKDAPKRDVSSRVYMQNMGHCVGVTLLSWLIVIITIALIALTLSALNRAMSWYSRPAWIFFLYIVPTFLIQLTAALLLARRQHSAIQAPCMLFRLHYDSNQLITTVMLAVGILIQVRSAFIPAMWVLAYVLGSVLRERTFKCRDWRILWLHLGVMSFPYIQSAYNINGAIILVVPIMGRSGSGNHAEVVLSLIFSTIFCLLLNFLVPLIVLVRSSRRVLSLLVAIFLVSVLTLVLTPLGFPYSGDASAPTPQRYIVVHVERTYHDVRGSVRAHKAGYWIVNMDVNSPRTVVSLVPEMAFAQPLDADCQQELYCGLPYIIPVLTFIWQTHWIPAPPPIISIPTGLQLLYKDSRPHGLTRLTFSAVGPDHMNVFVSPTPGVLLEAWSLAKSAPLAGPTWNGRSTYFVYYSCASDPEAWVFWLDLQVPDDHAEHLVDIGLGGHFIHGAHQTSVRLRRFLAQFPPWTVTSGWTASYSSYRF